MGRDLIKMLLALVCGFAAPALACDYPDEGNMPLRRAVGKVQRLPEIEAWAAQMHKAGAVVHYAVLLQQNVWRDGRCYWRVEVAADSKAWRRFLVTPDGRNLRPEG
jgi:hypothetical protein